MGGTSSSKVDHGKPFRKNRRGILLRTVEVIPENAKAILYFIQGYGEHVDRPCYQRLFKSWAQNGFLVYSHDHQGFGQSHGPNATIKHFEDYIFDLSDIIADIELKHPDLPFFIMGHSMGACMALGYCVNESNQYKTPKNLSGVVFNGLATLISSDILTPFNSFMIDKCSAYLPNLSIDSLDFGTLSRNKEAVKEYKRDKFMVAQLRAHFSKVYIDFVLNLNTILPKVEFPFLATHGSQDMVAEIQSSKNLFQNSKSVDKKLCILEGMFHEPFDDPEKDQWEKIVLTWLNERCPEKKIEKKQEI